MQQRFVKNVIELVELSCLGDVDSLNTTRRVFDIVNVSTRSKEG